MRFIKDNYIAFFVIEPVEMQGVAFAVILTLMRFIKDNYIAFFVIEPVEMQGVAFAVILTLMRFIKGNYIAFRSVVFFNLNPKDASLGGYVFFVEHLLKHFMI